jgi:hypothetical protein
MSPRGEWICYLPRDFARGRDYEVFSEEQAFSARVIDRFTAQAEEMLRVQGRSREPNWEYAPLDPDPVVGFSKCAPAEMGGAQALVVWGLLLPHAFVQSHAFSLKNLPQIFPPAQLSAYSVPAWVELQGAAQPKPSTALANLLSHYLETGVLRVDVDSSLALPLFSRIVEALAPRDRLQVSFATAPDSGNSLEVSSSAPRPKGVAPSLDGLARLDLWRLMQDGRILGGYALGEHEFQNASLRERTPGWVYDLLRADDMPGVYARLIFGLRSHLEPRLHEAALAYLRRALERRLIELPNAEAARCLDSLDRAGLLTRELGVPPLWLPRIVLQMDFLGKLSPSLVEKVLHPDAVPMLLDSVQRPPSLTRLGHLARALLVAPKTREPPALLRSCVRNIQEILEQGLSDHTLARATAILLLHEYAALGNHAKIVRSA